MYFVRTTKTVSGATAVQIVRYEQRKKLIVKHIGSAHTREELVFLLQIAGDWIEKETGQQALFPAISQRSSLLIPIEHCQYLGFRYAYLYEVFQKLFRLFRLDGVDPFLRDLVLMRIVQPASKLESLELRKDLPARGTLSWDSGVCFSERNHGEETGKFCQKASAI
jgi:hypothetical protein